MLSSMQPAVRQLFSEMRKFISDGVEISHLQINVFGMHTRLLTVYIVFTNQPQGRILHSSSIVNQHDNVNSLQVQSG